MYCIENIKIIIISILWIFVEFNWKMLCIYCYSICSNFMVYFKSIVIINEYYCYRIDSIVIVYI